MVMARQHRARSRERWRSATVQGQLLKGCLESIVRYDSRSMKVQWQCYASPMTESKVLYTLDEAQSFVTIHVNILSMH